MKIEQSVCVCVGQENATIDCDEGVPITPFNLKEEMEEGHFDSEGNYFIKKEKDIRDNWLDNIDWVQAPHPRHDDLHNLFTASLFTVTLVYS